MDSVTLRGRRDVPTATRCFPPASAGFRPDIEGLRALAVLAVLVYHANLGPFAGGFIGVDVFFVLSGFLITSLLLRELASTGTLSLSGFWARRARRLLPASALVIVATLVLGRLALDGLSQAELARDAIAASTFVVNIRFAAVGTDYLASQLPPSPLLHYWSLAVEEQFYLVWPVLLVVLGRALRMGRRVLWAVIASMWLASFVACLWFTTRSQPWAFFMLPTRAWELLTGVGLAFAGGTLVRVGRGQRALLGWMGVAVIVVCVVWFDDGMRFPGWLAVLPVAATMLVVNAGGPDLPMGPNRLLRAPSLQWLGARSYAIYLWHFPLLVLADRTWGPLPAADRLGILALSVVVAAISFRLVENPVRHSSALAAVPARSLAMGVCVIFLGVGCASVLLNHPPPLDAGVQAAPASLVAPTSSAAAPVASPDAAPDTAPDAATTTAAVSTPAATRVPTADASKDDPPELAALVAANLPVLEAGVSTAQVPSNLSPGLGAARDDLPQVYDNGCILDIGENTPKSCIYGDPNGSVTVVLFGDSHAAEWMPAMHQVASQHGWRLLVHTKKACPSAEIPTEKDPNGTDCARWRAAVIEQLGRLQPDLVVLSSYRYKQVGAAAGRSPDTVWQEGIDLTVSKVRPLTRHLLLLGDSATPLEDVPSCLAGNLSSVSRCMSTRDGAVRPSRLGVEREVAAKYDAEFIPTSDWMCTDTFCPVVVGNVLMYRDNSHITATASLFLAPYVDAALQLAMA